MTRLDGGRLPRIWVLELSSFQLETLESLGAEVATVLNISDDHLDRYENLDEYATVKSRVFQGDGAQVLNRQDARVRKMAMAGRRLMSFGIDAPAMNDDFGLRANSRAGHGEPWLVQGDRFLLPLAQLPIAGLHNAANAMAALALCNVVGIDTAALLDGLRSFRGLPHRVEKVLEFGGVAYYDDSKGTNVGATVAALEGLGRKVAIILGGDGKGQDFAPLREAVRSHARAVVLIGRDAELIAAALADSGVPIENAKDMETAVRLCAERARPGDAVLLSPACASWDMYRNYAHRAEVFVAAVQRLQAHGSPATVRADSERAP
jgi:UDP-N-acetylmuramoylalanine--D-glutamate ligase